MLALRTLPSFFCSQMSLITFFLQRYIIGGIFLCFSPRQESLCKKVEVDVEPAAKEKPNDVETGAASAGGNN